MLKEHKCSTFVILQSKGHYMYMAKRLCKLDRIHHTIQYKHKINLAEVRLQPAQAFSFVEDVFGP